MDIVYAFARREYAFEKVSEEGGSHNSFSQMTVYPRRADLVREWQAAMDPEKLTRVFVGNEGFDRRYALGFCQALPLNGDLSTHSHLDR